MTYTAVVVEGLEAARRLAAVSPDPRVRTGGLVLSVGAGLLVFGLLIGLSALRRNGRLKNYPQLRRPFGIVGVCSTAVGLVVLVVGIAIR